MQHAEGHEHSRQEYTEQSIAILNHPPFSFLALIRFARKCV